MTRLWISITLLFFLIPAVSGAEGQTLTLEEAFQRALNRSETIAIREEEIRIAEGHYLQALGTVLPHLNLEATETIQDTSGSSGSDGSVASTFTRRSRPEVAVTLRQPLFQGLREFRALKVSSAEKTRNRLESDRARQILFADVARAYYTVLELEEEASHLQALKGTLAKRLAELGERVRLGKSRESEILAVESELASLDAEREKTGGLVAVAREFLGFLIGGGGEDGEEKLSDEFNVPVPLPTMERFLASLQNRPDLKAASEEVSLARGKLSYEKGGLLPTLDLQASYYPYRVGFVSDIDWDLLFTFNLPLFQGGATRGKIREAKATLRQSELAREESLRRSETELRQAYHRLRASLSREEALRRAEAKAAANYKAEVEDHRLGLINHLEVLQSLRDWQERLIEKTRARFQSKLDYLVLKTAAGDLPLALAKPDARLNRGEIPLSTPMTPHLVSSPGGFE